MSNKIGFVLGAAALFAAAPACALTLSEKLDLLVAAYPDTLAGWKGNALTLRGGETIEIDDGVRRDHFAMLAEGDVEDSLRQLYEAGPCDPKPSLNSDPGRIRSEPLMKAMYGDSANIIKARLSPVDWFGETLRVTSVNGVDKALAKVRDELAAQPDLRAYLAPSAGVFNWRKVSGQPNLSVHSFGAAIDLNTKYADYWVWSGGKPGRVPVYANKYPMEIVEIFERHGFIWGGRWYHYDTMHFEYRPELIAIGRASGVAASK
ncbi:M15 family metallopeptidase [Rhizobium sp. TRM95796]|uniref:M15 family metallopeptidase n=1 Tax=Rhizobium sp. TRM95796 TaxID=2979862 RepID=UPI0021E76640|nr:M15 family metallopeptidase [Rhizobium sp. TRM95796]MCV3764331.1 M15 family metallopeptidase [Rhizobium sp. TRM95796]